MFSTFFCAMALHPEAQKREQEERGAVMMFERLPQYTDRPSLQYVNAIVKETLRWHSVGPLGIPRNSTNENKYRGWRIRRVPPCW